MRHRLLVSRDQRTGSHGEALLSLATWRSLEETHGFATPLHLRAIRSAFFSDSDKHNEVSL